MISYQRKCIFIHIPKTGGTSIENAIWPSLNDRRPSDLWMGFTSEFENRYQTGGLQHLLAKYVQLEVGERIFNEFYKFAVVRNPFDRAVSQYTYMAGRPDLRSFIGMNEGDSFEKYLALIKSRLHVQWECQHKFIFDDRGTLLVDRVARYERFQEDLSEILTVIGVDPRVMGHDLKGARGEYREYYDEDAKEMLVDLYREDLRLFNYAF